MGYMQKDCLNFDKKDTKYSRQRHKSVIIFVKYKQLKHA